MDTKSGERTTIEFWLEGDRLAGKETVVNGQNQVRPDDAQIKASETGEMAFDLAMRAEVGKPSESTMSFSYSSAASGETGRLTKDGLQVGAKTFTRR